MTDQNPSDPSFPPQSGQEEKKEHLNLRVVGSGQGEIFFKIKKTTPLKKLMEAYCEKQGRDPNTVRFMFDGQRLNPTDTPDMLGMENEDTIDVVLAQYGGK